MMLKAWGLWMSLVNWFHSELRLSAKNFMCDLRSMRALWNWLFLMLYTWVVVWCVLFHADTTGETAITITGGIVSWIFSNYVVSRQYEKHLDNQIKIAEIKVNAKTNPDEMGESD